jgi:hypothetical protein
LPEDSNSTSTQGELWKKALACGSSQMHDSLLRAVEGILKTQLLQIITASHFIAVRQEARQEY